MAAALLDTSLPFPKRSGKVRDVYDLGNALLIVATDRISAYDVVMPDGIPGKGALLTALTLFWFEKLAAELAVPTHVICADASAYPAALRPFEAQLAGRSMLVKKARVIPIECVARGYLAGSGWSEYSAGGSVCGVPLPPGLQLADKLPEPIFTPATKEEHGHDVNVDFAEVVRRIGEPLAAKLRQTTLAVYRWAADYAFSRGVIIADTKLEFGQLPDGSVILIDEVLTPDSSRFWPAEGHEPGREPASFDKQFLRDYLTSIRWPRTPPAPRLPAEVIDGTRQRYLEAYRRLTGREFPLE